MGLQGSGRRPTNLAKVRAIIQGPAETPAGFLERLLEGYRMYTPFDPMAAHHQADIIMSFIRQSAPDICSKLQRMEGLQGYSLQDLVKEAERIFNKREIPEEKEESKILATTICSVEQPKKRQDKDRGGKRRLRVDRDQCVYCKMRGHWIKDCPKCPAEPKKKPVPVLPALTLEDSD